MDKPLHQALREERGERLNAAMAKEGFDLLAVVANPWRSDALRYTTGVALTEGYAVALIERSGATRLLVESPDEAARIAVEHPELKLSWSGSAVVEAERLLAEAGKRSIGLAPRVALPYRLAKGPHAAGVAKASAMLDRLMMKKSPAEIEAVRRASAMADDGYTVFMKAARIGRPEYQLVADVEAYYRSRGCPDNFQILGSGNVEVRGMHPPGERKLQAGDLVTTELTPCIEGYYAQICRTLVIGEPTEAQKKAHAVYNEAMEAGIAAVRPGVTAGDVARALNDVFRKFNLGQYVTSEYTRVRGHGLGLYADGKPSLLEDVDTVLEEDMTLIVHPNTYHPDIGYFVHGDSLRVTATGCEVFCKTPRELFSVPAQ
jgi:Xaa-Pro dipeptidase